MLEQLKRRSAAEPENKALQLNVVLQMAREERSSELVAPLMDRGVWNQAGEYSQGLAAIEVGRRLGGDWELSGLRVWSCGIDRCKECGGRGKYWVTAPHRGPFFCKSCPSHRLATYTHKPTGIEFQLLPGRSKRGCDCLVKYTQDRPSTDFFVGGGHHNVFCREFIEPFLIARWPVTESQTINFMVGAKGFLGPNEFGYVGTPQVGWSFEEVLKWCKFLGFSLPTTAQWQYACKAGSNTRFYWGDEFDPSHVWFAGNSGEPSCGTCIAEPSINHPHPPKIISHAEHEAAGKWNAFGLVDMIGNVFEWVDPGHTYSSSYLYSRQLTEANFLYPNAQNSESLHDVGFRPIKTIDWSE